MSRRDGPWILAGLLAVALLAELAALAWMRTPAYDESVYRGISRNILRTGLPHRDTIPRTLFTNSPPLVLYVNAGLMTLTGDRLPVTRLATVALWGSLLALLVLAIGRRCLPAGGRLAALALLATMPLVGQELLYVQLDLPLTVLATAVVWAWIRWAEGFDRPGTLRRALAAGVLLALGGLIKYSAELLGPLLAFDLLLRTRRSGGGIRTFAGQLAALALPSILGLAVWYVVARACGEDLLATFLDLGRRVSEARGPEGAAQSFREYALIALVALNPVVLLLAVGGSVLVLLRREEGRPAAFPRILAAAALHLLFFALITAEARQHRYHDPALPLLAILAAAFLGRRTWSWPQQVLAPASGMALAFLTRAARGIATLSLPVLTGLAVATILGALAGLRSRSPGFRAAACFLLLALAVASGALMSPLVRRTRLDGWDYARAEGARIRRDAPAGRPIAVSDPALAYHADRPTHLLLGGRDYRSLLEGDLGAVLVTEDWLRDNPHRESMQAVLDRRYVPAEATRGDLRLYLRRGEN